MNWLSSLVDSLDLSGAHTVLAIYGGIVTIFVMQTNRYEAEDHKDPQFLRGARTLGLAALAGSMFWSVNYALAKDWEVWPPFVLAIFAVDMLMTIRILAIWARIRRVGRYPEAIGEVQRRR